MTSIFDRHRIVDFTEHPVVVLMDTSGRIEVHGTEQVCTILIGEALREVADDLIAEHPNRACTPTAVPSWERPAEPLLAQGSTFDLKSRVWTDGTGHAWDLSVDWRDVYGRVWHWTGVFEGVSGLPLMRNEYRTEAQPLDALREVCGPISPVQAGGVA